MRCPQAVRAPHVTLPVMAELNLYLDSSARPSIPCSLTHSPLPLLLATCAHAIVAVSCSQGKRPSASCANPKRPHIGVAAPKLKYVGVAGRCLCFNGSGICLTRVKNAFYGPGIPTPPPAP